jgi:hypothetical protein
MSLYCNCISVEFGLENLGRRPFNITPSGYDVNGNPFFNFTTGDKNFIIDYDPSYIGCSFPFSSLGAWELKDDLGDLYATCCLLERRTSDCPLCNPWTLDGGQTYFTYFITSECVTPTPTPIPVYDCIPVGINECNVITLFKMGVNCVVTQPSQPESSDGVASLVITGGTPPYSIIWSNGGVGPSIYNLSAGSYEAVVVDSYGDFTANTTCVLTGVTTTTSTTSTTTTSPYPNLYELCMVANMLVQGSYIETQTHYTPNGIYDGKPTWISDDNQTSIIWDNPNSQWLVSAATPTLYVISNLNPTYPPIYGSWFLIGATGSVIVYEGFCQTMPVGGRLMIGNGVTPLTMTVTQNQTMCGCDGGLTIFANGGTPPYSYSIDGGLTYKTIPVFSNLCSGSYNVIVTDYNGLITSKTIILNPPSKPTTYSVSLNTTSELVENSNTVVAKSYTTTLNITPSLPDNVTLTFDISHLNTSKSSPNNESATFRSRSGLSINGESLIPYNVSDTSETSSIIPGCQSNKVYIYSDTETWSSVSITNKDVLELVTKTSVTKNESTNCYIGTSDEKYSLTNLKIRGCNCCFATTE